MSNANAEAKWLDAEVVVQLANAADSVGGIGCLSFGSNDCPVCLYGLAAAVDGVEVMGESAPLAFIAYKAQPATTPILKALQDAGISYSQSDAVVERLHGSFGRVTDFEAYLAELGVKIRGVDDEAPAPDYDAEEGYTTGVDPR